ncbi:cupin domain-containing protein [Hyphococcus luteus]|uniref:Uncharacterized protein n=1 Tax=Hyphococcus luteus TaxID=2058213 RepID=A0A2S7K950_9PROT|nr:hypothetical protein [Marinicaulis flavus]PQA88979.1 hypothetical protein CW354_03245 [Marinicaulis flavus]
MFWKRGGSRFDLAGNSLGGWIVRILILALLALGIIVMVRLWLPAAVAQEEENPIPFSGGALVMKKADAESENAGLPHAIDAGWKGEKVCELLFENDETRVARCTFAPGVGHERHYHPPHFGYILKGGTMRITDASGTQERTFDDGATWWSDGVPWHEVVNVGDAESVYLIFEPKSAAQ